MMQFDGIVIGGGPAGMMAAIKSAEQNQVILLEKNADQCELNDNAATVTLTQDETFKFNCRKPVQIQVRVLTQDGDALTSGIKLVDVDKCLDDEVLE